jgi:hypothetical protein
LSQRAAVVKSTYQGNHQLIQIIFYRLKNFPSFVKSSSDMARTAQRIPYFTPNAIKKNMIAANNTYEIRRINELMIVILQGNRLC